MKKKKGCNWKKAVSLTAATAMLVTAVPVYSGAITAEAGEQTTRERTEKAAETENLENIAAGCTITTSGNDQQPASNLVDGNTSTLWVNNGADWPCTVEFKLPAANTKAVKKVVVKMESGHSAWGVDVDLSYALNNVTSDLVSVPNAKKTIGFDDGYTYTFDVPQGMSHLYVTLSDPTNGGAAGAFWPAMAEVEIYVDKDAEEVVELENIANTQKPEVQVTEGVSAVSDKGKLTDGDSKTGMEISQGALNNAEAFVQLDFGMNQKMREFGLAIPAGDGTKSYQYTILGKKKNDTEFSTITTGTMTDCAQDAEKNIRLVDISDQKEAEYAVVKAVFTAANDAAKQSVLTLNEFQVLANKATILKPDAENIAWDKKNLHSNYPADDLGKIVDGNTQNTWTATQYPAYVDIDLDGLYDLSQIEVFTPTSGYSQYTLYASEDGQNFKQVAKKTGTESCTAAGEAYAIRGVKASVVRVLMEYNSKSEKAVLNEVRVMGNRIGEEQHTAFTPPVDFKDSGYEKDVTQQDVISEVQGIVKRTIGEAYVDWFTFIVGEEKEHDYYQIEDGADGKIQITGNDGVSLATGLNHYLKYFCNVCITQVGNQVQMPKERKPVGTKVYKESAVDVRYAYNYCTMSYSMPFWGEEEWRKELDWLALNGVNLVLDITGQEEVWRQFLSRIGYDHASIKDFIAGPAYYAWAYMANLSGYGGPVHDNWFTSRTELARKNHLIMKKLGMQPVLQGYSGMVPSNIKTMASGDYVLNDSDIIVQGTWCSFKRPDMLVTTSAAYDKYAKLFYECQANVFGKDAHYYATDPFHEGGNTGSLNTADVSENIIEDMLAFDQDAVWVIQAWQGNPTPNLMSGLNKAGKTDYRSHALVLDLYAEKSPWWNNNSYYPVTEFNNTPWVYCMLNNFGGRMGLHGHMDNLVSGVVNAANTSGHMTGIGITPEGSQNNPVLYDLLFETVWTDDASKPLTQINTDQWLKDYVTRRYGMESENAYQAMLILENTVYKAEANMLGQGAPESYINARPSKSIGAASTWGNAVISYDMEELEDAAELLLADYDQLKNSDGYLYDLADILKQVLSNSAQKYHAQMVAALNAGNLEEFTKTSDKFLELIDQVETVLSSRKEFLLGTWVDQAVALAAGTDDFTKDLYEFNAKSLVTTWGAYPQAESGGLKDYSNRQWAGLTKDFYKVRWQKWIDYQKAVLRQESPKAINWFEFEWAWARGNTDYTKEPSVVDLKAAGRNVLDNYSSQTEKDGSADQSYDYPVSKMTASSPNYQDADGNRPADVLDGKDTTLWHTRWGATDRTDHYIVLKLQEATEITGVRYLPRPTGSNGLITKYEVYVSSTGEASDYTKAASGEWAADHEWKQAVFEKTVTAQYVKLVSVESTSEETGHYYSSAAELRVTTPEKAEIAAESMRLIPVAMTMQEGESRSIKAKIKPAEAGQKVLYSSSDEKIVKVDENGTVTAAAEGKAVITAVAATNPEVKGTVTVSVTKKTEETPGETEKPGGETEKPGGGTKPPVTSPILVKEISLQAETTNLAAGKKSKINLSVLPENAANKKVVWTSSNPKYATVKDGVVTANKAGAGKTVTITATAADGSKTVKAVKIKIYKKAIRKIRLKSASKTVKAGKRLKIKAVLTPAKGIYKGLEWKASNSKYAVVTKKGIVKTKKTGKGKTVKITARAKDGSGKKAVIKLKIK